MALMRDKGATKGMGAEKAVNKTGNKIPLGTAKDWRRYLIGKKGLKFDQAVEELVARQAGNPNLTPILSDAEQRSIAEYAKLKADMGQGLSATAMHGEARCRADDILAALPPPAEANHCRAAGRLQAGCRHAAVTIALRNRGHRSPLLQLLLSPVQPSSSLLRHRPAAAHH